MYDGASPTPAIRVHPSLTVALARKWALPSSKIYARTCRTTILASLIIIINVGIVQAWGIDKKQKATITSIFKYQIA